MLYHPLKSLVAALAFGVATTSAASSQAIKSRRLTEYLMPVTQQTHEPARVPNTNFVLLTQMSSSELVKIELDAATEDPIAYQSFPMGKNSSSMLHGAWPSVKNPGLMWLSLQGENKLLLVDPGKELSTPPQIKHTIDIPKPGNGPHCVFEIGDRVWAGLKDASPQNGQYYAFSVDLHNSSDWKLYQSLSSPVFIREEPTTGLIYVTQDWSSSIMRIDLATDEITQLPIPPSVGNTAVGMASVTGALSGVWFTLAGNATGGTGTFGHIGADGQIKFFSLRQKVLGGNAALLHVADASTKDEPALWILSTSLLSTESPDALIHVTFDQSGSTIKGEEYISLQTQNAKAHRVLVLDSSVLVSELNTFTLAQLKYENTVAGQWLPSKVVSDNKVYDEAG
ncbi:uncharacterized protein APUU_40033A [Aspergillus puulaauensis]|uniref:Methanethiol oxidase n=1 Tax=Aspergillus puulaauensis TaxID=1220207 RepID=A0A7R8AL51_9EURO|nr:uncharacterized protein APUU_40033A [Aspergillus puulaauensis]BCS23589.1 hypothetical protein APUU_40033A [Aspergillus puulaauensis]